MYSIELMLLGIINLFRNYTMYHYIAMDWTEDELSVRDRIDSSAFHSSRKFIIIIRQLRCIPHECCLYPVYRCNATTSRDSQSRRRTSSIECKLIDLLHAAINSWLMDVNWLKRFSLPRNSGFRWIFNYISVVFGCIHRQMNEQSGRVH